MSYEIKFRPLIGPRAYSDIAYDATDYIKDDGLGTISSHIDNSDFVVGVFSSTSVRVKFLNYDKVLSDPDHAESIFRYSRDRAIAEISVNGVIVYRGILNEEATREDEDEVSFTILGLDSVLKRTRVGPGPVRDGMLVSQAILNLLSIQAIALVAPTSADNINVDFDFRIENAGPFLNKSVQAVLNDLLVASNAFLYVDNDGRLAVNVRNRVLSRDEARNRKVFYAAHDKYERSPKVLKINNFNNGLHRAFNSFSINERFASDQNFIDTYGLREKELDYNWITSIRQAEEVSNNLLINYRVPKREFELVVRTEDLGNVVLGDVVSVEYGPVISPPEGEELITQYGVARYGQSRYNISKGSIRINGPTSWIVYARKDDTKNFVTALKLREYGIKQGDSTIEVTGPDSGVALYGEARYGEAVYG